MSGPPYTLEAFTAGDGHCWRYRRYAAPPAPRGRLVCIHGIQSHAGWYEDSCLRWSESGFQVSFLDRRGSGVNERDRGDAPGFRRLLDDLAEFLRAERAARPVPVILVAISWGGKLAAALQRRHPGLVDGLVLLCPGFVSRVRPTFLERVRIVGSRLVAPRRLFPVPLNDPALFTESARWQDFVQQDPLALREATARLLLESARLDGYLRFVPSYVKVPVLLLLAERDRIIHNEGVRRYVGRFASPDKQVIEYPAAHHTLEFEPEPRRFIEDVTAWARRVCVLVGERGA